MGPNKPYQQLRVALFLIIATTFTLSTFIPYTFVSASTSTSNHNVPNLRGIDKSNIPSIYTGQTFTCVPLYGTQDSTSSSSSSSPGTKSFPISIVNDDYCDCLDGSDEPGTSACSNSIFTCTNAPRTSHAKVAHTISASFVNDGVCDCCDGSDEYEGRVKCPDTCKSTSQSARSDARKKYHQIKAALKKREKYVVDGNALMDKDRAELEKLEASELKQLQDKGREYDEKLNGFRETRKTLETKLNPASGKDGEENTNQDNPQKEAGAGAEAGAGVEEQEHKPGPVHQTPPTDGYHGDAYDDMMQEDEGYVSDASEASNPDDLYNPIPSDHVEGHNAESQPTEPSENAANQNADTNANATPTPSPPTLEFCLEYPEVVIPSKSNVASNLFQKVTSLFKKSTPKAAVNTGESSEETAPLTPEQEAENDRIKLYYAIECERLIQGQSEVNRNEQSTLENKIGNLKTRLEIHYGNPPTLRAVYGNCLKSKFNEYEYEHCPFKHVNQFEHGNLIASLGSFSSSGGIDSINDPNPPPVMLYYTNGQHCWKGPQRSISIELICGENEEILSVVEPSRCVYQMKFSTPTVCSETMLESVRWAMETRDEL